METDTDDFEALECKPNKRIKILTLASSPESSTSKGKSKLEVSESESENETNCCGICLSESGHGTTIIRGCIDCCDHYFCFVCIMEWSKVESTCPMCKRRFSTIRRPAKPPVFPSDRIVNVPVRDQVYHQHGNVSTGPPDPYSEVQCNVCRSTADDSLLLLCDLCDSAAHTYCVGLGATVPEGDWFCADCSLLRAEQAQSEIKTDCNDQTSFAHHHLVKSTKCVSIYDIVREPYGGGMERSPMGSLDSINVSSRVDTREHNTSQSSSTRLGSEGRAGVAGHATKFNARTLGHCRNVHGRIRTLRENWNGFRSGSLRFSSSKTSIAVSTQRKPVSGGCSGKLPSVSCSSQPPTSQSRDQNKLDSKESKEIEKAWKMMNMAKAIEGDHDRNIVFRQASKPTLMKKNTCKEAGETSSRSISSLIKQKRSNCIQNDGPRSHYQCPALKQDIINSKGSSDLDVGFSTRCGPLFSEVVSSKECQTSLQLDDRNNGLPQQKNLCARSTYLISSIRSASTATTVGSAKELGSFSSTSMLNPPREKLKVEKSGIKNEVKEECAAKTEIQSLVKLNLKILSREKKLEVGLFKKVARLATHSILAACGLEHQKPEISSLPECVCVHVNEVTEFRRSTLMPNSCRECFFSFVKNVVNTILLDNS